MKLKYYRGEYTYGGTAIKCRDEEGFPYADCSVCLVDYGFFPKEDEIVVPTYQMMPQDAQKIISDLAEEVKGTVKFGYAEGTLIKLRSDWKEFCEEM